MHHNFRKPCMVYTLYTNHDFCENKRDFVTAVLYYPFTTLLAALATSVGNKLRWRLKRSWHWVRKLLQLPGSPSYFSSGCRRGPRKLATGMTSGAVVVSPQGPGGIRGVDGAQEAKAGGTAEVLRFAIWCTKVCMCYMTVNSCCCCDSRMAPGWPSLFWSWAWSAGSMLVRT